MGAPGLDRSTALAGLSGWSPALPDQTQPPGGRTKVSPAENDRHAHGLLEPNLDGIEIPDGIFTRAAQIPHSFIRDSGDLDGGEVA